MRVVLRDRQRAWNDLGHVSVSPSCLIFVGIVRACGLQPLQIREVEGLLRVGDELAFLES